VFIIAPPTRYYATCFAFYLYEPHGLFIYSEKSLILVCDMQQLATSLTFHILCISTFAVLHDGLVQ